MSTYFKHTKHPITGEWENAQWIDDYYGSHLYAVQFPSDGKVFDVRTTEFETRQNINCYWGTKIVNGKPHFQLWYGNLYVLAPTQEEALLQMAQDIKLANF